MRPRRGPWLVVSAAVVLLALGIAAWTILRARPAPGPIILISIDTLRADHLPVYGYRHGSTPAIDAFAAAACVFERAYAHAPQTLPSHVAMLSGRLPFETGVRDNVGFTVRRDLQMLPAMLRKHGYATGGVVSTFVLRPETGIGRQFDFFDGTMPEAGPDVPMGQVQRDGLRSLQVAEQWMNGLQSDRFFLFFHIYEPHKPYEPPARYRALAPYDGEIAYSDEIVGRLFQYLQQRGWYHRATIVLTADHGEGLGDHGEQEHGLFLYDETIRVPLVMKLPGDARPRRIDTPVQHIDLVPTLVAIGSGTPPAGLRGRSLLPLMQTGRGDFSEAGFYAESLYGRYHFGWSELYALTDARYRFIRAPRPEIYDLRADPHEKRNQAAERPQAVAAMRSALDAMLAGVALHAPGVVAREDMQRLQALGYVGNGAPVSLTRRGDELPDPKDKASVLEAYRQATELSANHRYDEAIALLRQIVSNEPGMKDVWTQLAIELVHAGRSQEALAAFERLSQMDPADANALVSAAGVLFTLGRLDESASRAEAALRTAPADDHRARTSACEMLIKVALARGDERAASRYAAAGEQIEPGLPLTTYVRAMTLYNAHRYEEALPFLQDAVRRLRGGLSIPDLYYYVGDTFARLGEAREAEAAFRIAIRLAPSSARAHAALAMLCRADGRVAEADEAVERLVTNVPTAEGYNLAIKLWTAFGERDRAEQARGRLAAVNAVRQAGK